MTLLTMIQDSADEIGLPQPAAVFSSTDQTVRQMLALANREGRQLAQRYKWQALTKEASFANLVDADSVELLELNRVDPGNPDDSYLIWKLQ